MKQEEKKTGIWRLTQTPDFGIGAGFGAWNIWITQTQVDIYNQEKRLCWLHTFLDGMYYLENYTISIFFSHSCNYEIIWSIYLVIGSNWT